MSGSPRGVAANVVGAWRIGELGPRNGDEVGVVGDVEVAVGAVFDGAVVDPDVMCVPIDADRVATRRAAFAGVEGRIFGAVPHAVPRDREVTHDDVGRARANADRALHVRAARAADDRLVGADVDCTRGQLALHVNDPRRRVANRRVELGQRRHEHGFAVATAGRAAALRRPTNGRGVREDVLGHGTRRISRHEWYGAGLIAGRGRVGSLGWLTSYRWLSRIGRCRLGWRLRWVALALTIV